MFINTKIITLFKYLAIVAFFIISETSRTNNTAITDNTVIDDAKITLEVRSKLFIEKGIPSTKLNVETRNGNVYVSGKLDSAAQAMAIIKTVESINGVKDIDINNLEFTNSKNPLSDSYITAKIKILLFKKALFDEQASAAKNISVETKNGVVYLTGKVANKIIENDIISTAKQVNGVTKVISFLKLENRFTKSL